MCSVLLLLFSQLPSPTLCDLIDSSQNNGNLFPAHVTVQCMIGGHRVVFLHRLIQGPRFFAS